MLGKNTRGDALGQFVYRAKYLDTPLAVEIDSVELKLPKRTYKMVLRGPRARRAARRWP